MWVVGVVVTCPQLPSCPDRKGMLHPHALVVCHPLTHPASHPPTNHLHACALLQMCAAVDVGHACKAFHAFFTGFGQLDRTVDPDMLGPPELLGTLHDPPCCHVKGE